MDDVVLVLRCPESATTMTDLGGTMELKDVTAMIRSDWDELCDKCGLVEAVIVRASRSILSEHSAYFRSLLGASFKEAESQQVTITWDLKFLFALFRMIFTGKLEISATGFCHLLEGAIYFGVDELISACQAWAVQKLGSEPESPDVELLRHIPVIWSTTKELGFDAISALCVQYLSINFEDAVTLGTIRGMSYPLLDSCIDHEMLTVSSEKRICEAVWQWSCGDQGLHYIDLRSKVRISLLPVDCIRKLYGFVVPSPEDLGSEQNIRLTKFLKVLDLTRCHRVTDRILLSSVLSAFGNRFVLDAVNYYSVGNAKNVMEDNSQAFSKPAPKLENLKHLRLGQCWRLSEHVVAWFASTCPNLRTIELPHCPQVAVNLLVGLATTCALLEKADFSMDVIDIVDKQPRVETTCASASTCQQGSPRPFLFLVTLSLQGRLDLSDAQLSLISAVCPSISSINLSGCRSLSDTGIAAFLSSHRVLKSLYSAHTAFGPNASSSLLQGDSCSLEALALDHCPGMSEMDLIHVLSHAHNLKHLSLNQTKLTDAGLLKFQGTRLRLLSVQSTQVTGAALVYVLRRNAGLRTLNFRDCKNISTETIFKGSLVELEAGWGFPNLLSNASLASLRRLALGLGTGVGDFFFAALPSSSPSLEHLHLCLQNITEDIIARSISENTSLRELELQRLLQPLSAKFIDALASTPNLVSLKLENVSSCFTDSNLVSLGASCKNLQRFSLAGIRGLGPASLDIIICNWPLLHELKLEDCDGVTRKGASQVLQMCRLETLSLRHNGSGLCRSFISKAAANLPFLRSLSLDLCDAIEGYITPEASQWGPLYSIKLSYCTLLKNSFGFHRKLHKHTVVLERGQGFLRTSTTVDR